MLLSHLRPVAQGLRTDHPIPGVAFVDDARLPLEDPAAIEAIGRKASPTWGRTDPCGTGWVAFTTDAEITDLAWLVRHDPRHGRTVLLVRNEDVVDIYSELGDTPQLLASRKGGYWWDGTRWYRPLQVFDHTTERFVWRAVPDAQTVSAAQWADFGGDASEGRLWTIQELAAPSGPPASPSWYDDLALWAARRPDADLRRCTVTLRAPQLAFALINEAKLAEMAGITVPHLPAVGADRRQVRVPAAQAEVDGSPRWAVPVAHDWVEARRREACVSVPVSAPVEEPQSPRAFSKDRTAQRLRHRLAQQMQPPADGSKRWSLPWRSEEPSTAAAGQLAEEVVQALPALVPMHFIAVSVQHAILDEIGDDVHSRLEQGREPFASYDWTGLRGEIARTLDWMIQHDPIAARWLIVQVALYGRERYGMPNAYLRNTLLHALGEEEMVPQAEVEEFLDLNLVFEHDGPTPPTAGVPAGDGPDRPRPTLRAVQ